MAEIRQGLGVLEERAHQGGAIRGAAFPAASAFQHRVCHVAAEFFFSRDPVPAHCPWLGSKNQEAACARFEKIAEDGVPEQVGQRNNAAGEDRFGKGTVGGKMVLASVRKGWDKREGKCLADRVPDNSESGSPIWCWNPWGGS